MNTDINANYTIAPATTPVICAGEGQTIEQAQVQAQTKEESLFSQEQSAVITAGEGQAIEEAQAQIQEALLTSAEQISTQEELQTNQEVIETKTGIEATLDGKITATQQGKVGDCWLLSSVNSLNATAEGKALLNEILNYDETGVNVTLKGINKTYHFTNEQLKDAQYSGTYSSGDLDMNAIELAVQQGFVDICKGEAFIPEAIIDSVDSEGADPFKISNTKGPGNIDNLGSEILKDNTAQYGFYLLTGELSYMVSGSNFDDSAEEIAFFGLNNNENKAMAANISKEQGNIRTEDIYGNKVELPSDHIYSITKVEIGEDDNQNETNITITNPHDSSEEITLNRSKFMGVFDWITALILPKA